MEIKEFMDSLATFSQMERVRFFESCGLLSLKNQMKKMKMEKKYG